MHIKVYIRIIHIRRFSLIHSKQYTTHSSSFFQAQPSPLSLPPILNNAWGKKEEKKKRDDDKLQNEREAKKNTYIYTHIYIYTFIQICWWWYWYSLRSLPHSKLDVDVDLAGLALCALGPSVKRVAMIMMNKKWGSAAAAGSRIMMIASMIRQAGKASYPDAMISRKKNHLAA